MKLLTNYTLLGLQLLSYVATISAEEREKIAKISQYYQVSCHHMAKVAGYLAHYGYIDIQRGKRGGVLLIKTPASIKLGNLLRLLEQRYSTDNCYNRRYTLKIYQRLIDLLSASIEHFFSQLNEVTLADMGNPNDWPKRPLSLSLSKQFKQTNFGR